MTCGKHTERTICLVESRDNRELAPTTGVEGGTGATESGVWRSVTTIPWARLSAGLIASALFAGGVALFSTDPRHRLWGQAAVGGYALAALAVMAWRSRRTRGVDVALAAMMCGAILFPLLWLIAHGYGEPEVGVVANSARELIHDGTPYRSARALAATTNPNAYNPYLPLMAVFGVPRRCSATACSPIPGSGSAPCSWPPSRSRCGSPGPGPRDAGRWADRIGR